VQARENAQQWEKRAQQLQQKYGKVDLAEHQRVQQSLTNAEAELANLRNSAEAQRKELEEQLKKVSQ
jgi:alkylation response protein AidB-like acyl-CoA dehydrogenase